MLVQEIACIIIRNVCLKQWSNINLTSHFHILYRFHVVGFAVCLQSHRILFPIPYDLLDSVPNLEMCLKFVPS